MEDSNSLLEAVEHPYSGFIILAILIVIAHLIGSCKIAFNSLNTSIIDELDPKNSSRDRRILSLYKKKDDTNATFSIFRILLAIAIAATCFTIIQSLDVSKWIRLATKIAIPFWTVLIIYEITSRKLAKAHPLTSLRSGAPIIAIVGFLMKPLTYLIATLQQEEDATDIEVKNTIEELNDSIHIDSDILCEDKAILTGLSRFVNTEVGDIMSPRVDVIAIDITSTLQEIKNTVLVSGFSRFPVYDGELDNVKGMLHVKELIAHLDSNDTAWQKLMKEPCFVTEEMKITDLLEQFQHQQQHLAIVTDEYGSVQGVISLEDIIEEVVGEISDESDKEKPLYKKMDETSYLFDGKSHIADFLRIFNLEDDYFDEYRGEAESLAGMMLEVNRDFLQEGASLILGGYIFIVYSIKERRIEQIMITERGDED